MIKSILILNILISSFVHAQIDDVLLETAPRKIDFREMNLPLKIGNEKE